MATPVETHAYTVARALGLRVLGSPVDAVVTYCETAVEALTREFSCTTLDELRLATANRLKTRVIIVTTTDEVCALQQTYVARKEPGFAHLETDLGPAVFGQTVRLLNRERNELPFVSIIDARGDKAARACFTEWHEYAHLLTLTNPDLAKFQRSHGVVRPPEEALMDAIAARIGFLTPIFVPHLPTALTFASIGSLRAAVSCTASWTSVFSAIARVWPTPVIVVRAEMDVKKAFKVPAGQGSLGFFEPPVGELRAIQAIGNGAARTAGFRIHPRMRVPPSSAIMRAFTSGIVHEGTEDLSDWESSQGGSLEPWRVSVIARATAGGVDALIVAERRG